MDKESESFQNDILAWLLQQPVPPSFSPESSSHSAPYVADGTEYSVEGEVENLEMDVLNSLDSQLSGYPADRLERSTDFSPHSGTQRLQPGEIHTVQNRFYTLIKRRLQAEIQHHLPLFPWESEVSDYEADMPQRVTASSAPALPWLDHLRNLNFPVPMPEAVLTTLFGQCQTAVQSSLREGARLVQAVESLFPGQSQALNHLAGLILVSPARSGTLTAPANQEQSFSRQLGNNLPSNYEAATPIQQMVLSLLAAREIMGALSLTISPSQGLVERQWLTGQGLMTLEVTYHVASTDCAVDRLRIQGHLPSGGGLSFQTEAGQAAAYRSTAGYVSVELFAPQPNQAYSLEVQLQDQEPLAFVIHYAAE